MFPDVKNVLANPGSVRDRNKHATMLALETAQVDRSILELSRVYRCVIEIDEFSLTEPHLSQETIANSKHISLDLDRIIESCERQHASSLPVIMKAKEFELRLRNFAR
jgi:hypothetical protein